MRTINPDITWVRVREAIDDEAENRGFCAECGEDVFNVEPEDEGKRCVFCGSHEAHGVDFYTLTVRP